MAQAGDGDLEPILLGEGRGELQQQVLRLRARRRVVRRPGGGERDDDAVHLAHRVGLAALVAAAARRRRHRLELGDERLHGLGRQLGRPHEELHALRRQRHRLERLRRVGEAADLGREERAARAGVEPRARALGLRGREGAGDARNGAQQRVLHRVARRAVEQRGRQPQDLRRRDAEAADDLERRHVGRFAAGGDREAGYAVFGESD